MFFVKKTRILAEHTKFKIKEGQYCADTFLNRNDAFISYCDFSENFGFGIEILHIVMKYQ